MKYTFLPALLFIIVGLLSSMNQKNPQATPLLSSPYIQLAAKSSPGLSSAVQSIKKKTGGRILSAKTVRNNGQRLHKIKVLLPSGKIRTFKINAQ